MGSFHGIKRRNVSEFANVQVAPHLAVVLAQVVAFLRLMRIHNVSVAAVKCQVVPGPIGHSSDLVAPTENVEKVQP